MIQRPIRLRRVFMALAGLALLTGLAACANGGETTQAPSVQSRSAGPVQTVLETALEEGALTDAQEKAVLAIQDDLSSEREAKQATRSRLRAAASDVVRFGTLDPSEMDRARAEAMEAVDDRMRVGSEALKDLHALLDDDQRELVADALRARIEERAQMRRDRGKTRGGKLREVMDRLMVDQTQRRVLEDMFADVKGQFGRMRPTQEEVFDLIDAFETEDFPQALDAICAEKRALMNEHFAAAGEHTNDMLRVLSPNQRLMLAEIIEQKR